jgi:phosphoglycolate phosphatase
MTGQRPQAPETLVFDLDGTLVDSSEDITRAVNRMLAEHGGGRVRRADVVPLLGEGAGSLVADVLTLTRDAPVSDEQVTVCTRRYLELYAEVPVRDSTLYANVASTLAALSEAGVRMGVCTNKSEALAVRVLEELGVLRHFGCIVGGDSLPVRKPDPAPLLEAVRLLGSEPNRSALVGDSDIDHECAVRARMPFHLVPWASATTSGRRLADFADLLSPLPTSPAHTRPTRSS